MDWLRDALGGERHDSRDRLLEALGRDPRVMAGGGVALRAIAAVPRELFVPARFVELAYEDEALELGPGATISAPSMVAAMVAAMAPAPGLKVLEIGAGSGYAAAVMAAAGMTVVGVEILPELVERARRSLEEAGFAGSVTMVAGDGGRGWPPGAPYDRVVASAAVDAVPEAWLDQCAPGGMVVYPESRADGWDMLMRLTRLPEGWSREEVQMCKFVPLHH